MNINGKKRRTIRGSTSKLLNIPTRFSIIWIFTVLFLLTFCLTESMAAEKASYVIGGIAGITGHSAYWGTQLASGEAFTVKQWMMKGGIKGYPIEFVTGDDEFKPDRALVIAKRLVEKDNVLAIVAGGSTASVTAVSPYLNREGVPFIFSAGGKTYSLPQEKFMFGVLPNTPIVIDYKLRWLKKRGITRVAIIADDGAYGQENVEYVTGAAKREGMDLVAIERYAMLDMDMTAMLARVKTKKPDGIILGAAGDPGIRNLKQMAQIGLNVPTLLPVACVDDLFIRNLGGTAMGNTNIYADGCYLMALDAIPDTDPRKIRSNAFVKAFEKEYGKKFNYGNGAGHDKMETILRAIEAVAPAADKIDYKNQQQLTKIREDIRTWLENAKGLELLTGTFSRSPEDHIGTKDVGMVRIIDGKWLPVD
jgi:branched-chain amino acid transport system substrate-binding protein